MPASLRHLPDLVIFLLALVIQSRVWAKILRPSQQETRWARLLRRAIFLCLVAGLAGTIAEAAAAVYLPGIKELLLWLALAILAAAALTLPFPNLPESAGRRGFLSAAARSAAVAPFVLTGAGAIGRNEFQIREIEANIAGLPPDLVGLRIVQLTDVHLGPFLDRRTLARAVEMANGLRADLAVITGDLITAQGDPLDDALAELARLKAAAGIFGCHGNHEIYAGAESYCTAAGSRLGIRFLRRQNAPLRFGNATLNLVGVDYQRRGQPYLSGIEHSIDRNALNILLSHNPDVFPAARRMGFALTLAGHTHGGQVNFEILDQSWNVARFYTPYTKGLYLERGAALYVSPGIGTVGIPVRLGAPAEVSLVKLCGI